MVLSKTNSTTTAKQQQQQQQAVPKDDHSGALVEFEPSSKDDDGTDETHCNTEAITKDEEWITKRKTELTTTRQIETRVKRQVKLQNGKVIEDSGPIVSTNTTEDTDKQETETTEKRDLGLPVNMPVGGGVDAGGGNVGALEAPRDTNVLNDSLNQVELAGGGGGGTLVKRMVPQPADGLVRQIDDKRVISHEEIKDYHETEDVRHLGDFADETYVNAVREGVEDIETALLSAASQQQLVPLGPQVIASTTKSRKTIDSEDTRQRCLAQPDGTLVTERKRTTAHELIVDDELPSDDNHNDNDDHDVALQQLTTATTKTVGTQRYFKQRDEQHVDLVNAQGKVVNTEMRYAAETMQMDKDGSLERPGDWDSLSDRMRKLRNRPQQQKALLQQQKEVALLADRKDALTKRPLDFDREEETRKGETMKWLESHFGSESTASNDSRDDADTEMEPTKKSYFNVTIKSQSQQQQQQQQQLPIQQAQTLPRTSGQLSQMSGAGAAATATTAGGGGGGSGAATMQRRHMKPLPLSMPMPMHGTENNISSGGGVGGGVGNNGKYFHGISNWADRQEQHMNHFSSQAFRDDLQETIKRNGLRKQAVAPQPPQSQPTIAATTTAATTMTTAASTAITADAPPPKRYSLSSQFLSKPRTDTTLNTPNLEEEVEENRHYHHNHNHHHHTTTMGGGNYGMRKHMTKNQSSTTNVPPPPQPPSAPPPPPSSSSTTTATATTTATTATTSPIGVSGQLGRPTVPQRRRAIEKQLSEQQHHHHNNHHHHPHQHQHHHHMKPMAPQPVSVSQLEPPPDYSPPPRSRSCSPQLDYLTMRSTKSPASIEATTNANANANTTLTRKHQQRTRFAPNAAASHQRAVSTSNMSIGSTTNTNTNATTTTTATTMGGKSKPSSIGQVFGNSLRKLVSKIRSASAERKLRIKLKSTTSSSSAMGMGGGGGGAHSVASAPIPGGSSSSRTQDSGMHHQHPVHGGSAERQLTTYQQYNVIDGHIGGGGGGGGTTGSNDDSEYSGNEDHPHHHSLSLAKDRRPSVPAATATTTSKQQLQSIEQPPQSVPHQLSPRQRYYLGEDPYSSSFYGKENIYGGRQLQQQQQQQQQQRTSSNNNNNSYTEDQYYVNAIGRDTRASSNIITHTLGRYQKHGQRLSGSTPNLNHSQDYRTTQTLPRKLHEHGTTQNQYNNNNNNNRPQNTRYVSTMERQRPPSHQHQQQQQQQQLQHHHHQQQQHQNQNQPIGFKGGPAKPARSYAKLLNRSKSFNVHGMNGSNDPSPIYIEKLTKNNYTTQQQQQQQQYHHHQHPQHHYHHHPHEPTSPHSRTGYVSNLSSSQAYKSNPHLFSASNNNIHNIHNNNNNNNNNGSGNGNGSSNKENSLKSGLKSPSIVNLISRSQKDLTKITDGGGGGGGRHGSFDLGGNIDSQQQQQQQQQQDYRLHSDNDNNYQGTKYQLQPKYSLDSRSPHVELNKDTACIVRRGSGVNNDGSPTSTPPPSSAPLGSGSNKRLFVYGTDAHDGHHVGQLRRHHPGASTIIELRSNAGYRK